MHRRWTPSPPTRSTRSHSSTSWASSQDPCYLTINRTLRNRRYKLLRFANVLNCSGGVVEEVYDLETDPLEGFDLMLMSVGAHLQPGVIRDNYLALAAELDEREARVVGLRYFSGLSMDEVAAWLDVAKRTAKSDWTFARSWLKRELRDA